MVSQKARKAQTVPEQEMPQLNVGSTEMMPPLSQSVAHQQYVRMKEKDARKLNGKTRRKRDIAFIFGSLFIIGTLFIGVLLLINK